MPSRLDWTVQHLWRRRLTDQTDTDALVARAMRVFCKAVWASEKAACCPSWIETGITAVLAAMPEATAQAAQIAALTERVNAFTACRKPAKTVNSIHGQVEVGESWSITELNKALAAALAGSTER